MLWYCMIALCGAGCCVGTFDFVVKRLRFFGDRCALAQILMVDRPQSRSVYCEWFCWTVILFPVLCLLRSIAVVVFIFS